MLTNDYRMPGQSLGQALIHSPPFWLVAVLTMSIILPWLRLRKVPVRAEVLSNHAVRLYFDYGKLLLLKCNYVSYKVLQSLLSLALSPVSRNHPWLNGTGLLPFLNLA